MGLAMLDRDTAWLLQHNKSPIHLKQSLTSYLYYLIDIVSFWSLELWELC